MGCFLCGDEAVDRCFTCGQLFCPRHGQKNCVRCQSGIAEGDPRGDRVTANPPQAPSPPGWWRPQPAEDYTPTACWICKGLTRAICVECRRPYCAEHAGKKFRCQECQPSSDIPTLVVGLFLVVAVLWFLGYWAIGALWGWLTN